jgi:GT2 family glycosyltransferase
MQGRVTVIIVTWNVSELVVSCIESLYRHAADMLHEVIVVDNASSDGTVAAVRAHFPDVRLLVNAANVGFPLANNRALQHAKGEFILFLNPDTVIDPGVVQACVRELDAEPTAGVVGCRLELEDGRVQLECARRDYRLEHLVLETLYLHMLLPRSRICGDHLMSWWDHRGERDVESISGAFMLARRSVVDGVGGLPDELFMYHEDQAFCLRARRAGWRIRYLGDHRVLHRWRGSSRRSTDALALLEGETKIRLISEVQGRFAAVIGRAVFAARSALRLIVGSAGALLLRGTAVAERYPRVFDWRTHWLQLQWALQPSRVSHRIPRASLAPDAARASARTH